jgi:hypothetical protein
MRSACLAVALLLPASAGAAGRIAIALGRAVAGTAQGE